MAKKYEIKVQHNLEIKDDKVDSNKLKAYISKNGDLLQIYTFQTDQVPSLIEALQKKLDKINNK